jgi:hypothetical protein
MNDPMTLVADLVPGDLRLLHDLGTLQRMMDADRVPARRRLDRELGAEFANAVRRSLAETMPRAA